MENEIYQILKKHKLPLKKLEEVLTDLLLLFSVSESVCQHDFITCGTKAVECTECKQVFKTQ